MTNADLALWIVMLIFVFVAAVCDTKRMKIPNYITFPGILTGLVMSCLFYGNIAYKLLCLLFLFFFGILGLMGMGDIKLWMLIVSFVGFRNSIWIILLAALFLILVEVVRDKKHVGDAFRSVFFGILHRQKPVMIDGQKPYPFALFMLTGCVILFLIRYY